MNRIKWNKAYSFQIQRKYGNDPFFMTCLSDPLGWARIIRKICDRYDSSFTLMKISYSHFWCRREEEKRQIDDNNLSKYKRQLSRNIDISAPLSL